MKQRHESLPIICRPFVYKLLCTLSFVSFLFSFLYFPLRCTFYNCIYVLIVLLEFYLFFYSLLCYSVHAAFLKCLCDFNTSTCVFTTWLFHNSCSMTAIIYMGLIYSSACNQRFLCIT
jgi:hypothetical protein